MSERDLIRLFRERFSSRVGDDAAVVGREVFTTDMLVEDVDFTTATPVRFLARKCLAVNLSDLAAMGATPSWALVALALPRWFLPQVEAFVDAIAKMAEQHRVEIIGGDLSRSEKLVIAVTAAGTLEHRALLRSGARPNDFVYLSRPVGGSGAGLALLKQGWSADGTAPRQYGFAEREIALSAIQRHLDPEPEVALGRTLARTIEVTSCIDVSDGLSTDLHHLCEASGCGATIDRQRIPLFPGLSESSRALGVDVREAVLHGGEEYALLFTSTLRESEMSARVGRPVYAIGRMTATREIVLRDGESAAPLEPRGWDHFTSAG
ncbi:MAG TPA: thiamine-phosphate kinase [Thermoanaerobaculia bacterium]